MGEATNTINASTSEQPTAACSVAGVAIRMLASIIEKLITVSTAGSGRR